jgi:hypothetical protein
MSRKAATLLAQPMRRLTVILRELRLRRGRRSAEGYEP